MTTKVTEIINGDSILTLKSFNGDYVSIEKCNIKLKYTEERVFIYEVSENTFSDIEVEDNCYIIRYTDVTSPLTASNLELADIIKGYINTTSGGGGGDATASNQVIQIDQLADIISNTNGLATETTLALVKTALDSIDSNTIDNATETTLALVKTVLDTIKTDTSNLDVNLSTRLSKADFEARINTLGQKTSSQSTPVVLPSDQTLNVTTTTNTNNPYGIGGYVFDDKVFSVAGVINMTDSSAINPLILIRNPIASGKSVYVYLITAGIQKENNYASFYAYLSPSITANGTALSVVNNKAGSATASVVNAFEAPTISANGQLARAMITGENSNSVMVNDNNAILLPSGQDLLLAGTPKSNDRSAIITVIFNEL